MQSLPQQFGVSLSVADGSGAVYSRGALPEPQSRQVRMGPHAYDGSYSRLSFVPFVPKDAGCLHGGETECAGSNITVETAHFGGGDCVILAECAGDCGGLALLVAPAAFWGAAIDIASSCCWQ